MSCHRHRHRVVTTPPVERRIARRPDLRVSDADRDQAVDELRAHAAEGRLGVEELEERIGAVLAAKTRADLDTVAADLPRAPRRRDAERVRRELREHVRSYLAVMALLVVIWALTGTGYFWPVWPILGWGIGVLSHAWSVRSLSRGGRRGELRAAARGA